MVGRAGDMNTGAGLNHVLLDSASGLPDRPSLLLSASIPTARDPALYEPAERVRLAEDNRLYADSARPERIRAAVISLTRVALLRGLRLVFGAHPTISPLVLQVARDMNAGPESILVFQSRAYLAEIPGSTLEFADWSCGLLVLTPEQPETTQASLASPPALKKLDPYPNSIGFMRELMTSVPGLIGGVFVGGMRGVDEEALRFTRHHPALPKYALGSTGAAARALVRADPSAFHGTLKDPAAFQRTLSYAVAASQIMEDLPAQPAHP